MSRPSALFLLACLATWLVVLCEPARAQDAGPSAADVEALVGAVEALARAAPPKEGGWGPVLGPLVGPLIAVLLGLIGYSREQAKAERAREAREASRDAKLRQRVRALEDHVDTLSDDCHHYAGCFVAVQEAVPGFHPPPRRQRRARKRADDSDDPTPTPKETR